MIIKKVILENIRSYTNAEIDLPEGSVLLAGNIGSGKSTVLMAVDFALFGIRRGELSGASLLRNGEQKGKVELHFEVDGKQIAIGRSLKRASSSISQDAGFISVDGKEKTGTAVELKQRIIELLNYPKEALTKDDWLYRYTVYTSQEQMKQILLCPQEERMNTLRRVFGIDKYKRISANAEIVAGKIKEKRKELAGFTADFEAKKDEEKKLCREKEEQERKAVGIMPGVAIALADVDSAKKGVESVEAGMERLKEARGNAAVISARIQGAERQRLANASEIARLAAAIEVLSREKHDEVKDFQKEIEAKEAEMRQADELLSQIKAKIAGLHAKKGFSEERKNKISELGSCPTCEQEVKCEHKSRIIEEETRKLEAILSGIETNSGKEKELQTLRISLDSHLRKLREEEKKAAIAKQKIQDMQEKVERKADIEKKQEALSIEMMELAGKKEENEKIARSFEGIEKQCIEAKEKLRSAEKLLKEIEIEKASVNARLDIMKASIERLAAEISKKEDARKSLEKLSSLQHWIEGHFIPLMDEMEKQMMLKVKHDFGSLFEKWFGMLVENEAMSVRLDDSFTPVIEQNGYELDYTYLSGGEKTAAALAYRLALNQVINDIMSAIKTRSIIILDEPTDGFSSEQLERMKAVLDELDISQVIIVSHEQKIESFVDNVIRFEKKEHVSRAAY